MQQIKVRYFFGNNQHLCHIVIRKEGHVVVGDQLMNKCEISKVFMHFITFEECGSSVWMAAFQFVSYYRVGPA